MNNVALYYPYFIPRTPEWLASALLWWEKMYLILPKAVQVERFYPEMFPFFDELRKLGVLDKIDPYNDAMANIGEFVEQVLEPGLDEISSTPADFSGSMWTHNNKLAYLLHYLDKYQNNLGQRYIQVEDDYVVLDKNIEMAWFSFLVERMSETIRYENNSPTDTVTDDEDYLHYNESIHPLDIDIAKKDRETIDLALLVTLPNVCVELSEFSMENLDSLLSFREDCQNEREGLRKKITQIYDDAKSYKRITDREEIDVLQLTSQKLKDDLDNLESALKQRRLIARLTDLGIIARGAASVMLGGNIPAAIGTSIIGIASAEALANYYNDQMIDNSPMAYLYKLKRFKKKKGLLSRLFKKSRKKDG